MRLIRKFKYFITFIIIVSLLIMAFIKKDNLIKNSDTDIVKKDVNLESKSFDKIRVDIKGAINKPGVYEVDEEMIVNDLITLAGGLREDADTSVINLAKKLNNEDLIIIYTKDEVKNSNIVDTVIKVVDKECVCPNIQNDGCINNEIDDTISNQQKDEKEEVVNNNQININTASEEELKELEGIGDAKAKAIIEYRKKNKFNSIDDLKNVDGIGQALYEKIKTRIRV